MPLNYLALVAKEEGDFVGARALFEQSLALCRKYSSATRLGSVLGNLGGLALQQEDYPAAQNYLEQALSWCEAAGDRQLQALTLQDLSVADLRQDRLGEAQAHCSACLRLLYDSGSVVDLSPALEQMACVALAHARPARAARLLGAAERLRETTGVPPSPQAATRRAEADNAAVTALGAEGFAAAFAEGKAMALEQALAYALGEVRDEAAEGPTLPE